MPGIQTFRTALGGFNRQDVVQYIEFINNQHNAQIEQLNTQLQNAREALAKATADPNNLATQLEDAQARCAQLEAQLEGKATPTDCELEAYRRAERAERMAQERAAQIYTRANAVLADATVKVEEVSANMEAVAQQLSQQLQNSKEVLQTAVADMYAIRPEEE